ncbi:MAG: hypothetical protein E7658_00535 [Ruminococcaceae bacterium]|nr:hypothetical protein [Oscillospiraceae bacterium]
MLFEAEVIPLFISGVCIISVLELIFGCIILKKRKKACILLIGNVVSMAIAQFFLIRCVFSDRLDFAIIPALASNSNSVSIGLFGVFWAISVFILLLLVLVCTKNSEKQ